VSERIDAGPDCCRCFHTAVQKTVSSSTPVPGGGVHCSVPYRIDVADSGPDALDRLIELGAIDADSLPGGGLAALMPDSVRPEQVASTLGVDRVSVSPAIGRDAGSVWVLRPRPTRIGRLWVVPARARSGPNTVQLVDGPAFGTALHPTTALCLEALQDLAAIACPDVVLDVGTGSGVLALAALVLGVPRALGIDIDAVALRVAAQNARINGMHRRLSLVCGGPEAIAGAWPLVLANVLAAPLIEMAPALVRLVGHDGQLVLSGIASGVAEDVDRAYRHLGLVRLRLMSRDGWVALVLRASW
jgi:ribosomal protein L11 methyltransferase